MVMGCSWIVAVGDELLSGHTPDGNSAWLARRLSETSLPCTRIVVIGDQLEAIAAELEAALAGPADLVFCCGGLGPTPDDRTMAALARWRGVALVESLEAVERIRSRVLERYRQGRLDSPEPNLGTLKMALVPEGARLLRNPVGGAPPLALELGSAGSGRWLLVLPGVPAEFRAVVEEEILPQFVPGEGGWRFAEVRFQGTPESLLFPMLTELESLHPGAHFGSYPQAGGEVLIRASAADEPELERALFDLRRLAPPGSLG